MQIESCRLLRSRPLLPRVDHAPYPLWDKVGKADDKSRDTAEQERRPRVVVSGCPKDRTNSRTGRSRRDQPDKHDEWIGRGRGHVHHTKEQRTHERNKRSRGVSCLLTARSHGGQELLATAKLQSARSYRGALVLELLFLPEMVEAYSAAIGPTCSLTQANLVSSIRT